MIVIGGGAGGLVVAVGAANLGASVALIEKDRLGGDCLWTGCVPTKSLVSSAKLVHHMHKAASLFHTQIQGEPDFQVVLNQSKQAIDTIQEHDDEQRFIDLGIQVFKGAAQFVDDHVVKVENESLHGKKIVIATGSRPSIPPIKGLDQVPFLTNDIIFDLEEKPNTLGIIGGGVIGIEFAQIFQRLGTKVTIFERSNALLPFEDEDIRDVLVQNLQAEGVNIIYNASIEEITSNENKKVVHYSQENETHSTSCDQLLIATGRTANTESLQCDAAGIKMESNGFIPVNSALQSNKKHIYAIGDVNGVPSFTHKAAYEGKKVVSSAVLGIRQKATYDHLPWVIYTDPELFHLGYTEKEAKQKIGHTIKVYTLPLSQSDRFIIDQETTGMIKIITDKKGYIVGAHAVGSGAGDIMQEVVFAKQYKHKIGSISQVIHPYPARSMAVQQTADLYWRETLFTGPIVKWVRRYVRWFR